MTFELDPYAAFGRVDGALRFVLAPGLYQLGLGAGVDCRATPGADLCLAVRLATRGGVAQEVPCALRPAGLCDPDAGGV